MAKLPVEEEKIIEQYGPTPNYSPKEGFEGRDEPDKVVETHCCFCGMQCGIKLLVKSNKVVGFDPLILNQQFERLFAKKENNEVD